MSFLSLMHAPSSVPEKNTRILFQTSVFMLIPLYYSLDNIFTLFLVFNFIFSCLHWNFYKNGSIFQDLDRGSAFLTLFYLILRSSTWFPLPWIISFFLIGHFHRIRCRFMQHLFFHLLFRAAFFCWCCHYSQHLSPMQLLLYSTLYILQITFLLYKNS